MLGKTKVKYIQSLGQKKQRDAEGVFVAEGPKVVAELLTTITGRVQEVYAVKEWVDEYRHQWPAVTVTDINEQELEKISQLSTPNQVLAVVKKMDNPVIVTKDVLSLALDGIQDPGNLGTIIRIADWFGISQVICSTECADMYNPKVVQATMGSIARVNVLYTELAEWLSLQDTRIYGAALEGQDVASLRKPSEGIIVIGNEARGINPAIMELINIKITIPKKGRAESLNAAVATGIIASYLT